MKIQRNKHLTTITGSDTILKLPTEKYDDIVGIINDVIPEPITEIEKSVDQSRLFDGLELKEYCEDSDKPRIIEFNDKKMAINDLYLFSDMNAELYLKSIFNASSKFEKDGSIYQRTIVRLAGLLQNIFPGVEYTKWKILNESNPYYTSGNAYNNFRDSELCPQYSGIRKIVAKRLSDIRVEKPNEFKICELLDDKYKTEICQAIINAYSRIFHEEVLYDLEGNEYTFPELGTNELVGLIDELLSYEIGTKNILPTSIIRINIITKIILQTSTWQKHPSGILFLMKNGRRTLVDISTLITKEIYSLLKQKGKSILEIKNFAQILL
jgi:hypothetical protein